MLDFYLVENDILTHNKIAKNERLGSMDFAEFEELQKKKIIQSHLDYYKDFRWTNEQVNNMLKSLVTDPNYRDYKLTAILEKAATHNSGLLANAD